MSDAVAALHGVAGFEIRVDAACERARDENYFVAVELEGDALVSVRVLRERGPVCARRVRHVLHEPVEGRAVHVHVGDVHEHAHANPVALVANHGHAAVRGRQHTRFRRLAVRVAVEPEDEQRREHHDRRADRDEHEREREQTHVGREPSRTGSELHTRLYPRRRFGWFGPPSAAFIRSACRCIHDMDARHARYPFLASSRQAVQDAGVDLAAVVSDDAEVVARATERLTNALTEREVGDAARSTRVELLSYPVARVIASLVDENILVRRYAQAEANTAHDRFTEDFATDDDLASVSDSGRVSRDELLREFDIADDVVPTQDGFDVGVATYLLLSSSIRGEDWRLVNRRLADGRVPVTDSELDALLREAVEDRIAEGLPLNVPDAIASELGEQVSEVKTTLSELDLTREIDTVVPELFPPCMTHLLERVQRGDHLPHHSRFAITAFLANIGLSTDEIVQIYEVNPGFGEEMTRYQTDHIQGETSPTEYTAPACATMKSYGDCVNPDALCDHISHPLSYYEAKLDDSDEDDLDDWRDRDTEDAEA